MLTEKELRKERRGMLVLLAVLCCLTLLPFLGMTDFNTKGEPREAVVSMSMLDTGNWILPLNNGGEMPYKPPFFHWMVALCSLLTGGEVTEYSSRLPSALALTGMTVGTFLFFARRQGNWRALTAALVAFTTMELHRAGMNTRVDMVLTALTVGAIMLLYRWGERGMRGVPWAAVLLMGCGTLTKGPVGILVPCLVAGIFLLLRGRGFFRVFILLAAWGTVSLALPLLWYYAAWRQGGDEFLRLVMEENFGRMTGTMTYDSCVNPWPYNIATTLAGFIPWTLLAVLALFVAPWRKLKRHPLRSLWSGSAARIRGREPERLLSLTAVAVIFLFYCFPQSKRSVYLMPLYPFLSLFVAELAGWLGRRHAGVLKGFGDFMAAAGLLATLAFLAVKCGWITPGMFDRGRHGADNAAMVAGLRDAGVAAWMWAAATPAAAALWFGAWMRRLPGYKLGVAVSVVICAIYMSMGGAYQPAVLNVRSAKPVAAQVEKELPASRGTLYEFIGYAEFQAGDPVHYFELNFYLGDRIRNFVKERPRSGYLVMSDRDAERYMPQFERAGYRMEPVMASGRKLVKEPTHFYRFERRGADTPIHLTEVK